MQPAQARSNLVGQLVKKVRNWFEKTHEALPPPDSIDREYIEGETPDEIGKISQMTGIPDKAQRHLHPDERKF